jgi:hypothetical protein
MQMQRQEVGVVAGAPALKSELGHILVADAGIDGMQAPQTGAVGHGLDIEYQGWSQEKIS